MPGSFSYITKCQHQITKIRLQDHMKLGCFGINRSRPSIVSRHTHFGLWPHCQTLRRHTSPPSAPVPICHYSSPPLLPEQGRRRRPGRPSIRCIDQLRRDNNSTPSTDLWRRSISDQAWSSSRVTLAYGPITTTQVQTEATGAVHLQIHCELFAIAGLSCIHLE